MSGRAATYAELFERGLKRCTKCRTIKPLSEFSCRNERRGDTLPRSRCKPCCVAAELENRNPKKNLMARLRRHRLSVVEFDRMVSSQSGLCAICEQPTSSFRIDHDHRTGEVRGLLCHNCNVALGHFRDDESVLRRAIAYLKRRL